MFVENESIFSMNEASLKSLYQSSLIEHSKTPLHYGKLASKTHSAEGFNPLCGDAITLYLEIQGESIESAQFESASCSICTAAASMMLDRIQKCSLEDLKPLAEAFEGLLNPSQNINAEKLGQSLIAFEGLREFPSRMNCARLPWQTLAKALGLDFYSVASEPRCPEQENRN